MISKRFISSLLCVSLLSSNCIFTAFADCDEDCTQKNSNGQFVSVCCAKEDAANKIQKGEHYIKMNNVGYNSDFTVYIFDYNNIEKVMSELPYMHLSEIKKAFEGEKKLEITRKDAIKDWAKFGGKLIASTGLVLFTAIYKDKIGDYVANNWRLEKAAGYINQNLKMDIGIDSVKTVIGNTAIASASIIPAKVLSSVPDAVPKMNSIDYKNIFSNNANTFSALEQTLEFIKYNFWKNNDVLVVVTNSSKDNLSSVASFNNYGIKYTDEEKQGFEDKFKSLKETLQTKINEYEKEQKEAYGEM